jgi:Flp pilus assembly protein TadG
MFKFRKKKGSMAITVAVWLTCFIGIAALAFDIGHMMIVRNELQNGADAAALAGANCLSKTTSGSNCTNTAATALNWTMASTKATNSIMLNKSDGMGLINGTVQTGYWNLNGGTALQPTTLSPLGPCTLAGGIMISPCDKPAVMVTLSRDSGSNGGAVGSLVGSMFGGARIPISASAVAVISAPGKVIEGTLIPQAIDKCMFDLYWDSTTNSPKLATASMLNGVPQTIGQPWEVRIGSSYHYGTCESGQWTSFAVDSNSASYMKDLVNNGNPTPLSIGDNSYIQPGTQNSGYNEMSKKYSTLPVDVTVLVVDGLATKTFLPIVAFAGFRLDDIKGGSDKYIQGHFISGSTSSGAAGIGPTYGTYTPPRLAQ